MQYISLKIEMNEWTSTCLAGIKWPFEYLSVMTLWKIQLMSNNQKNKERPASPKSISYFWGRKTNIAMK